MLRDWFTEYTQARFIRKGYDVFRYSNRITSATCLVAAVGIISYVMFIAD